MPRRLGLTFLLLGVGVLVGVSLRPNVAADQPKEKPIPVAEVRSRGVLGDLGRPLGTIVTIEGEVADGEYTKRKADQGQTLLRVKSVDGRELKSEVVFRFNGAKEDRPAVGAKFKYTGYETGRYEGGVAGREKYVPLVAEVGYWFRTDFHIFKDELKGK